VSNPLRVSAWVGLMVALSVSAGAREASPPPSELGPWPDPIEAELREGGETLALPEVDADARARQEVLPELPAPRPPLIASGSFELTVERQVPHAPMLPTVEEPAAAVPLEELPPAPAQGPASDAADAAVSAAATAEDPVETALRLAYDWPGQIDAGPPAIEPVGDPDSLDFVGPLQIAAFALLDEEVAPGTRARLYWNASQTYAGGDLRTPVDVVHGDRKGPVLCLTAAVHGDELNGVEVVRRVMKQLPPSPLAGTVIGVPVVNLFGFSRNSRYLPDRRDLNRFFPGSPTGSIASRIAYGFFDQVARHCDALVDMHTGSFDRINLPQVRADLRIPHVLEFTRGFGATPVLHSAGSRGMLRVAATQAGIPAVTFEVGGPGELEPREIEVGVQSLLTLVHKLGMVRDSPEWLEPQATFYESRWVRANRGGMLISDVALGERVQRGQRIGLIVDPLENSETDIVASVSGRVIGMALNQVVLPGYAIFHLGEETSETGAVTQAATGQAVLPYEEDAGRPPPNGEAPIDPLEEPAEEEPHPEDFE
jgi:predicted deacylase